MFFQTQSNIKINDLLPPQYYFMNLLHDLKEH
jgi:hypothetical protein